MRLAEQSYAAGSSGGIKEITNGLKELVGGQSQGTQPAAEPKPEGGQQKPAPKQGGAQGQDRQNKPANE
jgi:hypothetical protein